LRECMKFNEEVNRNRAVYLTFYWVFRVSGWICGGSTDGILVPFFGPVFWVDFSPFFGLRGSRERRVSRGLVKLDGDFGPFLSPILDGLFISARFLSLLGMFHVSRGRIYSPSRGGSPLGSSRIMILWFGTGDMCLTGGINPVFEVGCDCLSLCSGAP
jgi:hypothetical protein